MEQGAEPLCARWHCGYRGDAGPVLCPRLSGGGRQLRCMMCSNGRSGRHDPALKSSERSGGGDGADSLVGSPGSPHQQGKRGARLLGEKVIMVLVEMTADTSAEPSMLRCSSLAWLWLLPSARAPPSDLMSLAVLSSLPLLGRAHSPLLACPPLVLLQPRRLGLRSLLCQVSLSSA